jgi:hypothetical protein
MEGGCFHILFILAAAGTVHAVRAVARMRFSPPPPEGEDDPWLRACLFERLFIEGGFSARFP